jgi:hypothetical protein
MGCHDSEWELAGACRAVPDRLTIWPVDDGSFSGATGGVIDRAAEQPLSG